jgi:hypothetical protein
MFRQTRGDAIRGETFVDECWCRPYATWHHAAGLIAARVEEGK